MTEERKQTQSEAWRVEKLWSGCHFTPVRWILLVIIQNFMSPTSEFNLTLSFVLCSLSYF